MPSNDERDRYVVVGIVTITLLALLYGVFLGRSPLASVGIALPLVALYLLWRFVRAHERIADALE